MVPRPIGLKFGREVCHHPGSIFGKVEAGRPLLPDREWPWSASGGPCSLNRVFLGKIYKTKIAKQPRFSGGRSGQIQSPTLPRGPAATPSSRVGSAAVVSGPIRLKFGSELCYHPGSILGMVESGRPLPPDREWPGVLLEVRTASTVRFWENFIKQKLQNAPN